MTYMPAFFCLALTTAAVKSLFTNFRDDPLAIWSLLFRTIQCRWAGFLYSILV